MALYFAYGSNLSSKRLGARVPSARALGAARLADFAWRCNKRSADGSAKANLVPDPGGEVWGALYEIDAASLPALDRAEGGYARIDVTVDHDGAAREACTYVSDRIAAGTPPADWYATIVLDGAREHALPAAWIAALETELAPERAPQAEDEDGGRMVFDDPANRCFGCSPHNPRGLALSFAPLDEGGVETVYVAAAELCGMHGVVHGGVQATMMDEAMGFAAHAAFPGDALDIATIELSVRYHRPTPTGEPITLRARLVRAEGRDLWLEGEIRDARGRVCTEATSRWRRIAPRKA